MKAVRLGRELEPFFDNLKDGSALLQDIQTKFVPIASALYIASFFEVYLLKIGPFTVVSHEMGFNSISR
jgi:hypothetical protein